MIEIEILYITPEVIHQEIQYLPTMANTYNGQSFTAAVIFLVWNICVEKRTNMIKRLSDTLSLDLLGFLRSMFLRNALTGWAHLVADVAKKFHSVRVACGWKL